jgi:hypothetical protein
MGKHLYWLSDAEWVKIEPYRANMCCPRCPMVAYCGRCKRRKVVEFELPEEVKRLLLLYRWKTGSACPAWMSWRRRAASAIAPRTWKRPPGPIYRRRNRAPEAVTRDLAQVIEHAGPLPHPAGDRPQ